MYIPESFSTALVLTVLSAVFWGSWASAFKATRDYAFELFYWDYILGLVLCTLLFALTFGSHGAEGEPFLANLAAAGRNNWLSALVAGAIFNVANVLLVAACDMAGMAIAFPIAIGIAVVEGVVLSYSMQPKGSIALLAVGVILALAAVLFNARAYGLLAARARAQTGTSAGLDRHTHGGSSLGLRIAVLSGVLMGGFPPFIAAAMTRSHPLTPYSTAALFAVGALACCCVFNTYLIRRPLSGEPISGRDYLKAGARNHLLGLAGGAGWASGGCLNFVAAGFVGVPISYAIGQSAPLIAAAWGVFVWREFRGATRGVWLALAAMMLCYVAAIVSIAAAYRS